MNKNDKNKQQERPKVDPLGDMKISEARGKLLLLSIGYLKILNRNP